MQCGGKRIKKKKNKHKVAGKSDVCKDQAPFISDLALPETPALACSKNDDVIKSKRAHVSMNVCKAACFSRRLSRGYDDPTGRRSAPSPHRHTSRYSPHQCPFPLAGPHCAKAVRRRKLLLFMNHWLGKRAFFEETRRKKKKEEKRKRRRRRKKRGSYY